MRQFYPSIGVARLCGLFGKSRQALYDAMWRKTDELMQEELIVAMVKDVRKDLPKLGGVKLYSLLKGNITEHGIKLGRDAFFRLLQQNDLLVKRKKRYVITTMSKHRFKKWPNLIEGIDIQYPEQVWVCDITYLRTQSGFVYLSLITDACSRKIMGYHLSQELKARGCIIALNKALKERQYCDKSLIHHSDRGIQYCCDQYVSVLIENKIQISMTQSGSPYDNAIAERLNGILKAELGLDKTFKSYSEAIEPLTQSIYAYNNLRPHMSCNLLTPQQAHQQQSCQSRKWKNNRPNENKQYLERW
jgi:transposase InsO family protein